MLGTLVQGRVSLDGSANRASQLALHIAITYASQRRQFSAADPTQEVVLLDYQSHLHRLLPKLAATYAGAFAHEQLLQAFDDVFSGRGDDPEAREDLETLAAALKPVSTWLALDTVQECREACGGAGFIAENQLTGLHQDLDVYATFEGDNTVLLQLVAKRLLSDYTSELRTSIAPGSAASSPSVPGPWPSAIPRGHVWPRTSATAATRAGPSTRCARATSRRRCSPHAPGSRSRRSPCRCVRPRRWTRPTPPPMSTSTRWRCWRRPRPMPIWGGGAPSPPTWRTSRTRPRSRCSPMCATCSCSACSRTIWPGACSAASSPPSAAGSSPRTSVGCCGVCARTPWTWWRPSTSAPGTCAPPSPWAGSRSGRTRPPPTSERSGPAPMPRSARSCCATARSGRAARPARAEDPSWQVGFRPAHAADASDRTCGRR